MNESSAVIINILRIQTAEARLKDLLNVIGIAMNCKLHFNETSYAVAPVLSDHF